MKKINIKGTEYPCQMTMGAVLRFKNETDKEVSEVGSNDLSDLVTLIWCCVVSACNAEGTQFEMDLAKFADCMDLETLNQFFMDETADKKKEPAGSPRA